MSAKMEGWNDNNPALLLLIPACRTQKKKSESPLVVTIK